MDIVEWLRKLKMSTANADWNATIVNNRLDEAADEIERLREDLSWVRLAAQFYATAKWWDQGMVARAALKETE